MAPAVGLVGGTDEDYHKVLADIEEQMTDAVTAVDVFEGKQEYKNVLHFIPIQLWTI